MNRTIKQNYFYSHSVESVWEYLTKPELIEQWLMKNDFAPVVGHQFKFVTKPIPGFDFDGIIYCEVLEIIPHKKLVYTWKGGAGDGKFNLDSIVTWTLVPKENGTELLLEHTGLMENTSIYLAMTEGWKKNITKMDNLIKQSSYGNIHA